MAKLTDRFLKALTLPPERKDMLVFDDDVRGLGVRVTAKGTKAFIVQWTDPVTKRRVREPLGVWGAITIEQARVATRSRLGDVARGINPAAERRRKRDEAAAEAAEHALTLDVLVEQWGSLHLTSRRPRYAAEAKRALRLAFADHLKRPAARLSKAAAIKILDGLAAAGKATMAAQTLAYGRSCYSWGLKRGKVGENPFRGLPIPPVTSERDRVLSDSEVAEIWVTTGKLPYPFGHFYRLALLTLQRREEVAGLRWPELSADRTLWTIPAGRMKNNRPHDVHLAPAARAVLADIPRREGTDLVFTTTGRTPISGYSRAKTSLDAEVKKAREATAEKAGVEPVKLTAWRLHDFRRTGVSRLAAMGFDSIVADKLLAHKPAKLKGVASIYQRHDFSAERRKALEAWAEHVTGATSGDNVVRLRAMAART